MEALTTVLAHTAYKDHECKHLLRVQDEKQNLGAPQLQAWNTEQPRSVLPRPYATCLTIASTAINLHTFSSYVGSRGHFRRAPTEPTFYYIALEGNCQCATTETDRTA